MFSFAHPQYLYLLLLLPLVAALFWLSRCARSRHLQRFGNSKVIGELMPDVSTVKPWVRLVLQLLLLAMVIIILARPRAGASKTTTRVHGIEVMVAMDVSNSMNASTSDNPQDISRLQRSKLILQKLIDRMSNDKVGLVVFAGNAYMQMPMTGDAGAAKLFLNDINTNMVPTQGTAIGEAIAMCRGAFSTSKKSQKAIIVITDGENFEDDAASAAEQAHDQGIQVSVMGVGSKQGAPIPLPEGGFMTDDAGQTVTTFLDETTAQEIADAGHGVYVNGNAPDAVETLYDTLDKLAKSDLATLTYTQRDEQFPIFAWIAVLLLLTCMQLLERRNLWFDKFHIFSNDKRNEAESHHNLPRSSIVGCRAQRLQRRACARRGHHQGRAKPAARR